MAKPMPLVESLTMAALPERSILHDMIRAVKEAPFEATAIPVALIETG